MDTAHHNSDSTASSTALDPEVWAGEYAQYLFHFAVGRVRNHTDAQNLVQETFLAALKARDKFQGRSTEKTWLTGILKNKILDYFRTKYRETPVTDIQRETEQDINSFFDSAHSLKNQPREWSLDPHMLSSKKEFWETFDQCRSQLPDTARDVFTLRVLEGIQSKDICEKLNISKSNLWVLLHRARLQLRECLEKNWFMAE